MKAGTRKAAPRKAMRVATIFTGAAAAATFAPAAMAGTGHAAGTDNQARTDGKTLTSLWLGGRPLDNGWGSIRSSGRCPNAHWVHLEWSRGVPDCFGYRGQLRFGTEKPVSHECGGTNKGVLFSTRGSIPFGPGTGYRGFPVKTEAISIYIGSWTGNDKCGPFPAG
jgi:hypothetical protein